jgi:AraC-like DNA-binding protein
MGLDPDSVLHGVGLSPADLTVPDKWVPAADVARVLDVSARGPISVVLREEPDLRSALDLLTRYQQNYNEALHMRVTEADGLATTRLWFEFGEPAPSRQPLELASAVLYGIMRAFLGADWHPLSVCFSHKAPDDLTAYQQMFGARLQFEHEFTGMVFFAKDLDAPNAMSDPMLRAYTQKFLQSLPTPGNATTIERVKELVEMLLPLGRCSMDHIARTLDVDPRTLRRHLADQEQSFSRILHDTRARMAERYMHNERYSLTDISQQLGFAAPSAFTRWFRQQFGSSPRDWRRASSR